jgi:hypothetical protein
VRGGTSLLTSVYIQRALQSRDSGYIFMKSKRPVPHLFAFVCERWVKRVPHPKTLLLGWEQKTSPTRDGFHLSRRAAKPCRNDRLKTNAKSPPTWRACCDETAYEASLRLLGSLDLLFPDSSACLRAVPTFAPTGVESTGEVTSVPGSG